MRILLDDIDTLRIPLQSIQKQIDEINIILTHDGLRISTIDKSHVIFYELEIPEVVFTQYNIPFPKNITEYVLGVPTKELITILGKAKREDTLEIIFKEKQNQLQIQLINYTTNVQKKYSVQVMALEEHIPTYPTIQRETTITLPSKEFKQYISDITTGATQRIQFQTIDNQLILKSLNEFETNEIIIPLEETQQHVKARYTYEYLVGMVQATGFSEDINISFGDDMPLEIEYNRPACIDNQQSSFKIMLAPRIEEE